MRAIVSIATAVSAAVLLAAGAGSAVAPPTLTLASRQPVAVTGAHFRAGELVRVVATSDGVWSARVRADVRGRFAVDFPAVVVSRCSGLQIRAVGARGSVAALKLPLPACLPARNP